MASGGTERLWSLDDSRGLAANEAFDPERRLEADVGFGLAAFEGHGIATTFAGSTLSESGDRTMRAGVRCAAGPEVALGVEGTRRAPVNDVAPDHGIGLWVSLRWQLNRLGGQERVAKTCVRPPV